MSLSISTQVPEWFGKCVKAVRSVVSEGIWKESLKSRLLQQEDLIELLEIVSEINKLQLQSLSQAELYEQVCLKLADYSHYAVVWIGLIDEDGVEVNVIQSEDRAIPAYLSEGFRVSMDEDDPTSQGPVGQALLKARTTLIEDTQTNIRFRPWRERAKRSAIKSVLSIPLQTSSDVPPKGAIALYTTKQYEYSSDEIAILEELVQSIATSIALSEENSARISFEQALKASTSLLENIVSNVPVRMFWKDRTLRYLGCNELFAQDARVPNSAAIIGKSDSELIWSENAEEYNRDDRHILETGEAIVNRVQQQGEKWLLSNKTALKESDGSIIGVLGSYMDITQQQLAQHYLQDNEVRFRQLLEQLPNISVQGYDREHRVTYWNRSSETLYGYSKEEALGKRLESLIIPESMREGVSKGIDDWFEKDIAIPAGELRLQHKDGMMIDVYSSHVLLKHSSDKPEMFCVDIDLSKQKATQERLQEMADFDALTTLPNRHHLNEYLKTLISRAKSKNIHFGLFFIDLDNFKYINDTFGHGFGDLILVEVGRRLKSALREYDFVARFGGDEFVVTVECSEEIIISSQIAQKIIDLLSTVFIIREKELYVTASIGITLYPENAQDAKELLKQADIAMYQAKDEGKNRLHFYSQELNRRLESMLEMEHRLRAVIAERGLELYYQPQIDLVTKELVSCEALLRWYDRESKQFIPPDEFIPVAENTQLIGAISKFVIDEASQRLAQWQREGRKRVRVDINLPVTHIYDKEIRGLLFERIASCTTKEHCLGIEITETQLADSQESSIVDDLNAFKEVGVHISIDDFGTGYSSLSYLMDLHVDTIKIDKHFVQNLDSKHNQTLVRSIIAMAHALGYGVLAEGVETQEQETFLQESGCDRAQGYLYHRPMPADEMEKLL